MKTEEIEARWEGIAKSSKIKIRSNQAIFVRAARLTVHYFNGTQHWRQYFNFPPSSRRTSHLRCDRVEVRRMVDNERDG